MAGLFKNDFWGHLALVQPNLCYETEISYSRVKNINKLESWGKESITNVKRETNVITDSGVNRQGECSKTSQSERMRVGINSNLVYSKLWLDLCARNVDHRMCIREIWSGTVRNTQEIINSSVAIVIKVLVIRDVMKIMLWNMKAGAMCVRFVKCRIRQVSVLEDI